MKNKEEFKEFVKKHPVLINYTKTGEMSWQKFYELYSLYDEDDKVWNEYLRKEQEENISPTNTHSSSNYGVGDIINMLKGVKPEVLQQNIASIQKFLSFISEFVGDKSTTKKTPKSIYTPRPTNKIFED